MVGEAGDGLEAVEKARELCPDIILMDIGLPKLSSLAAARRVLDLDPSAKIIFLTQLTDDDVIRKAFRAGGLGYVSKQQAETELLTALTTVLQGRRFVSTGLSGDGFEGLE